AVFYTLLYWLTIISANFVLFQFSGVPVELTGFLGAVAVTTFMSLGMVIPGTVAGAGTINYGIIVILKMMAAWKGIELSDQQMNNIVNYSLLVYFSNLIPDLLVGG